MVVEDDRALKAAHRAMWERGDYPAVARDELTPLGRELVAACGIESGQRVLDVAAGTGNAAIQAAETGAQVVASDLTPALLEAGRREAAARGVVLDWVEADAENLPFEDGEFDVVMSCIGVMFAPHHQRAADEMIRVCRPGGTIGMLNWSAVGSIADFFAVHGPYMPPPPPDTDPPLKWGDPDYVRALFGGRIDELTVAPGQLPMDNFATPEDLVGYYKSTFGPTITAYANIADDPAKIAAFDEDFLSFARRANQAPSAARPHYAYDYLVLTTHKR